MPAVPLCRLTPYSWKWPNCASVRIVGHSENGRLNLIKNPESNCNSYGCRPDVSAAKWRTPVSLLSGTLISPFTGHLPQTAAGVVGQVAPSGSTRLRGGVAVAWSTGGAFARRWASVRVADPTGIGDYLQIEAEDRKSRDPRKLAFTFKVLD
jgi:hypothetical protein